MKETFLDIFRQMNRIPRPSHHEERIADFLCEFARKNGLKYRRDLQNCVVIEKPATPGYEQAEPIVILNHMDMVCVAENGYLRNGRPFNPLEDEIRPYVEKTRNPDGTETTWMKAEGTSLGADNGMGLSMALAILSDDSIIHGPLEVFTTTNEEDGMSGAEWLSKDFIHGRKVINLDSEAYDEITVGAAGAYLQSGIWKPSYQEIPSAYIFRRIVIDGGCGGHSGVDINKGRCNCIWEISSFWSQQLNDMADSEDIVICRMDGGTANASIASGATLTVALKPSAEETLRNRIEDYNKKLREKYGETDAAVNIRLEDSEAETRYCTDMPRILSCISQLPCGVIEMREDMPGTVMTSNNIGRLTTGESGITVSCHTRSFSNDDMHKVAKDIRATFIEYGAESVEQLMDTGAWMEREDSPLLALTCRTFKDVLGFEPRKVAMHFVLEAAYYVEKYPGVEIASIGPLIIEPHSTSERVNLNTADNIWKVTVEILRRLATK